MNITSIIIDSDQHAINHLHHTIHLHLSQKVEVAAVAKQPTEAIKLIRNIQPELIFMEIDLPQMNGLEILEFLKAQELKSKIIFVTANAQYAVSAYKFKAEAYLLKPLRTRDLIEVINPLYKERLEKLSNPILQDKLAVADIQGIEFVPHSQIFCCSSQNNYTCLHLKNGEQKVMSKTLKAVENLLPKSCFIRIHQSFIINLNYVKRYHRTDGGAVEMANGKVLHLSKSYRKKFLSLIHN